MSLDIRDCLKLWADALERAYPKKEDDKDVATPPKEPRQ